MDPAKYLDNSELMTFAQNLGWTDSYFDMDLTPTEGMYRDAIKSACAFLISQGYTVEEDINNIGGRYDRYINIVK